MINYGSIASLAIEVPELFKNTVGRPNHPYDWRLGVFQYLVGLAIVFCGLIALEGASLSLASKTSPANIRSVFINVGTITTFLGFVARLIADAQIVFVDLSHKVINTDIVNSLVVPSLLMCFLLSYVINRHFFFLM